MKWPLNYLVSIALHALVLFALVLPVAHSQPKPEIPSYLELTLTAEPEPAPPPKPLVDGPGAPASSIEPDNEPAPAPVLPMVVPEPDPQPPSGLPIASAPADKSDVAFAQQFLDNVARLSNGTGGDGIGGRGAGGGGGRARGPGGHTYEAVYVPRGITWYEANRAATARGGYLATISSRAENDFVFGLVNDPKFWKTSASGARHGPWLGGYRNEKELRPRYGWHWVKSGEPFDFQNWTAGEPDNLGNTENRLHFFGGIAPTWNDLNGNNKLFGYVIEFDPMSALTTQRPP